MADESQGSIQIRLQLIIHSNGVVDISARFLTAQAVSDDNYKLLGSEHNMTRIKTRTKICLKECTLMQRYSC